ncbi:hypothetical protein BS50DRAFT_4138 [Corynespora cassiicola Philippines]|uniref:Uncharacterized protein n=1 Tax=Corynespora cassiicola Philippines TaxID=1448308 RepID=A0A2T2P8G5_CORCC|nr:hypothetical protein BS50DRAFT_4138 [Corynespora cassiicola Philippines]
MRVCEGGDDVCAPPGLPGRQAARLPAAGGRLRAPPLVRRRPQSRREARVEDPLPERSCPSRSLRPLLVSSQSFARSNWPYPPPSTSPPSLASASVLARPVLPCPALPCPALPCPACPALFCRRHAVAARVQDDPGVQWLAQSGDHSLHQLTLGHSGCVALEDEVPPPPAARMRHSFHGSRNEPATSPQPPHRHSLPAP